MAAPVKSAEEKALHLKVEGGTQEVVIRHGDAAPVREHSPIRFTGAVMAPAEFLQYKQDAAHLYSPVRSHVRIDSENNKLTAYLNDGSELRDEITGVLAPSKELEAFKINTGTTWEVKDLRPLVRLSRHLFDDPEKQRALLLALETFKATVTKNYEDQKQADGNQRKSFEAIVGAHSLKDASFTLRLPIYKGQEPQPFTVDVLAEVSGNSLVFALESVELLQLLHTERQRLLKAAAEPFGVWGCSIVTIS